jgi:hypothetical protein
MTRRERNAMKRFERERELLEAYLAEQGEDLRLGCLAPAPPSDNNENILWKGNTSMEKEISGLNGRANKPDRAQEIDDDYFVQQPTTPLPATEELDLDEYRAGKPLKLTDITALAITQKAKVHRPKKTDWFRCWSNEALERVYLYEGEGIEDYYLVHPSVVDELPDDFYEAYLVLCVNSSGRLFLWPIKTGDASNEFAEIAITHVSEACGKWVRRKWVSRLKTHQLERNDRIGDPQWPENLSMREIVSHAFAGKVIKSLDHPCLQPPNEK